MKKNPVRKKKESINIFKIIKYRALRPVKRFPPMDRRNIKIINKFSKFSKLRFLSHSDYCATKGPRMDIYLSFFL